jgi:hypothetical protein
MARSDPGRVRQAPALPVVVRKPSTPAACVTHGAWGERKSEVGNRKSEKALGTEMTTHSKKALTGEALLRKLEKVSAEREKKYDQWKKKLERRQKQKKRNVLESARRKKGDEIRLRDRIAIAGIPRICPRRVCRRTKQCVAPDNACIKCFTGLIDIKLNRSRQQRRSDRQAERRLGRRMQEPSPRSGDRLSRRSTRYQRKSS